MTANDLGRPERSNVTTVFVTVLPDPIPVFSQLRYRRNISDEVNVGYEVVRVSATEPNLQVRSQIFFFTNFALYCESLGLKQAFSL